MLGMIIIGCCSFPSRKLESCNRQLKQRLVPNTTSRSQPGKGAAVWDFSQGIKKKKEREREKERNVLTVLTVPSNMLR